jgi:protein gp37
MAGPTTIEWTDVSWNPVTGCDEVSPGCDHCYARAIAERFKGVPGSAYEQGFALKLWPQRLQLPNKWKKPRMVFVNSMSDIFHKDVPDTFILAMFQVMAWEAPQHVYQLLTKRPSRLVNTGLLRKLLELMGGQWPNHIWLGTSVESQEYSWRIEKLLQVPALIRFISAEPLLGPLDVSQWLRSCPDCGSPLAERSADLCRYCRDIPSARGLAWVITGAESGHGARPMDVAWVRSLRDQCVDTGTAFFLKQYADHNGHKIPTPALDGVVWKQFPTMHLQPEKVGLLV